MTPTEFHDTTRPIWNRYGGSVTGGLRSIQRNADKGGDENSRHLFDLAEDGVLDDPFKKVKVKINNDVKELSYNDACINEFRRQGLIALWHNNHIHVQAP